jgi:hypothetical protein
MTRAQWTVVLGLLLFILIIFGVLLFQLQVPEASPTAPPPAFLLEEGARARTVWPAAEQEAKAWQADAQLTAMSIVWDDLGPGGVFTRDRWSFEYYSPAQQRLAVIRVVGGTAERLRTALTPNPVPGLALEKWVVDSTQALDTWWKRGGGQFVAQYPSVAISLKLRTAPDGSRALWIVTGSSSGEHHVVQIDGETGEVVD